jgi:hypothetical protein
LAEFGIFDDPALREAAKAGDIKDVLAALGEAIQRSQLSLEFPAPQFKILSNIAVAREIPGFERIADWKATEAKAGRPGAKTAGLVEHNGKLWRVLGEFDALVLDASQAPKPRIIVGEEVKTGVDSPTDARAQAQKAVDALRLISQGASDVRVFERPGPQSFAADLTTQLDLTSADTTARVLLVRSLDANPRGKASLLLRIEAVETAGAALNAAPDEPERAVRKVPSFD